ncbi:MAG: signal peptidase II [Caldimicrobium sp.]
MKNFFLSAILVFLLDRITKYMVIQSAPTTIEVSPFINFVKSWNKGVAFGFFQNAPDLVSTLFLILIPVVLVVLIVLARKADSVDKILYGAIFGGGLGNWLDRLFFGAVFDFIDLHIGDFHWPSFNLADLAISIALILLFIRYVFNHN